jgi:hypothetical protein
MDDRPASQKRPTGQPSAPFKWNTSAPGDSQVTIARGKYQGKQGVVNRWGLETNQDHMVYRVKLTTGGNVVIWAVDVTLNPPAVPESVPTAPGSSTSVLTPFVLPAIASSELAAVSGAPSCMVVYGGVSLC